MSGSSTQTTTTPSTTSSLNNSQSQNQPWAPTQQSLANIVDATNQLGASGVGMQPYSGSMVIPFSQQTTQGMQGTMNAANASLPGFQNAYNQAATTATGGGFDPLQQFSADKLQQIAGGSMLNNNPYLQENIDRSTADIVGANKMQASAAGRYGSGGYQGVTDKAVGDMSSNARLANYNTERGYQENALGSLMAGGQQRYQNQLAAPGALSSAFQASLQPYQSMMGIGQMNEDLATRTANDQMRVWQAAQDAPWQQLQRMSSIINPIAGLGGTSASTGTQLGANTQTNVAQKPSPLAGIAGGAIAGAGAGLGPWGALAGGLLGAVQ